MTSRVDLKILNIYIRLTRGSNKDMENPLEFNEESFNEKVFKDRYSMIKHREIKEAVERYRKENADDSRYLVLESNVRKDRKAKELYSTVKAFNDWKEAENFSKAVTHSIVVDTEKKREVENN